jgi:hypothetical protein
VLAVGKKKGTGAQEMAAATTIPPNPEESQNHFVHAEKKISPPL